MEKEDKEISNLLESIITKRGNVTSDDGFVTLTYSGAGNYTKVTINCFLEEISKEDLEKDFIEVLAKSKEEMTEDIVKSLEDFTKAHNDEENEVTIKDVS